MYRIKRYCTENRMIQTIAEHHVLRRSFICFLILAILLTMIGKLLITRLSCFDCIFFSTHLASLFRRRKVKKKKKTMIKPQFQFSLYRSSTLISFNEPNIRGESLYIAASVLNVNFSEKRYTINFSIQPNGTLANEYGQLK